MFLYLSIPGCTECDTFIAADIAQVVQYAMDRGIRVIPEIDTPGHVWAGFAAMDGLLTTCYEGTDAVGTGPLDPSKESTFAFLATLLAELAEVFPDKMFMVGGDEVDFGCWESNPDVQKFVASKGWGSNATGSNLRRYGRCCRSLRAGSSYSIAIERASQLWYPT